MAKTPLYKSLKQNGTTFYAFPGAAEDISAAYQNSNYKMYFSKYTLLNLPKQDTTSTSSPNYFDFDVFSKSTGANPPATYGESIVESLRNYVANQEVTIRESRLNNTEYYYNNESLETTSEKIFWKWCKKLNILQLEPALPSDEYFSNLTEFESRDINNDEYFPEYLWKEREIIDWDTVAYRQTGDTEFNLPPKLEIEFSGTTNLIEGDVINIYNVSNSDILNESSLSDADTEQGVNTKILKSFPSTGTVGQRIIVDLESTLSDTLETTGQARLVYNRLVQYVGEINGVSNVQEANRSYTEVYAHIPDHTGKTPDVLFRTLSDENYKPNVTFPIIPNQYQPEIRGAELFNSPIVSSSQNYPGGYFGQFDTLDFTYRTSNGDSLRRNGDYYGVKGDINNPVIDNTKIDGVTLDFDTSHYVKMNIPNRTVSNFDQFNALNVNNEPPRDFEFNAILWYYSVEDNNGNTTTNLYGISFLDNPSNSLSGDKDIKFPTIKKLVANGEQDGTSYAFNLSLNFNIINDNPTETYNPEAINSMFSMNLFNKAMQSLSSTNDSFLKTIAEQSFVREELNSLKGLLYTQTDLNTINTKISNLEKLLSLYTTNQIENSSSIEVVEMPGNPPTFQLINVDNKYDKVDNILSSELYTQDGIVSTSLLVPRNRDFLINIKNDDKIQLNLDNNDKLTIILDKDLSLMQTLDINITGTVESTQNKKLDIFMVSNAGSNNNEQTETLLIGGINLPVYYNSNTELPNSSYLWDGFDFNIDFSKPITLISDNLIQLSLEENYQLVKNSLNTGDSLLLNNLFFGEESIFDYSGQYILNSITGDSISGDNVVVIDIGSNNDLVSTYRGQSPFVIHSSTSTLLRNKPYFSLNKGSSIKVTRVSNSDELNERYQISINRLN
jgi:hypothetical protein